MIRKLVDFFDQFTKLPIDVNDVRDQLVDFGVQDEITFHFVDIDPTKLRGLLYRYTRHPVPYAQPIFCADICISKNMDPDWQRLVAVKELLHITDCEAMTAESEEAVDNLLKNIALPPEVRLDDGQPKASLLNDKLRVYNALAILLPKTARESLRNLHEQNKVTAAEIAQLADIPTRFIPLLMDDKFELIHGVMLEWEDNKQVGEAPNLRAAE